MNIRRVLSSCVNVGVVGTTSIASSSATSLARYSLEAQVGAYQTRTALRHAQRHAPSYLPPLLDLPLPPQLPPLARLGASAYAHVRAAYDRVRNGIDAHDHGHDARDDYYLIQIDDARFPVRGRHSHSSLSSGHRFQSPSPSGNVELVPQDGLTK